MTPLGIALVGCGGAARDVADAVDAMDGARIVATYDSEQARATDLAGPRGATAHRTLAELLADPAADVVYVGLPHDMLAPVTRQVLIAGRHVLAEKPLALEATTARELAALARERSRVLAVLFEFRASDPVLEARRLVAAGAIGAVRAVRIRTVIDKPASYWASGPAGVVVDGWRASLARAGGGVVLMNAIHQLDVLRFTTRLPVVRAVADIANLHAPVEVEDTAGAILRLEGGALVTVAAAAHSPGAQLEERIEIDGEHGRLDLPDPYGSRRLRVYARGRSDDLDGWTTAGGPAGPSHRAYLDAFVAAVRTGGVPPADGDDAAAALEVVQAIYAAARSGSAVELER
jgi:UDP-N-acetyl-2-amino-2-deoxyglucuronate dehydrogenase